MVEQKTKSRRWEKRGEGGGRGEEREVGGERSGRWEGRGEGGERLGSKLEGREEGTRN